jgi:hypothetical protein
MKPFFSVLHEILLSLCLSTCVVMTIYLIATIAAQSAVKVHDDIRHDHPEVASRVEKV